ncbi:hypothetical protein F4860DRAFT_297302 [Xylaria cubensis]|nr:hypothetical protein F4860DRAFT_297302 [Xylaria cubensis]
MQTRQTIVMALMAFASIAKCQMAARDDDDECSSTTAAVLPVNAPSSLVDSVFTPIASPDDGSFLSFITTPAPAATSASAAPSSPPAQETTTTEAATSTAEATPPPATPTSTAEIATPSSGSSSSSGGQGLSGACAPDGMFNCVGGNSYQQCANGQWAPLIPLAAKCSEGQSMTLWRRDEGSDEGSFQSRRRANCVDN